MKLKASDIKLRPFAEKDFNFIMSTWLKSYKSSEFAHSIPNEVYYTQHQNLIYNILKHSTNSISILCSPDDDDQIIGYIVYNTEIPLIFYTYVKHAFRKYGVGRILFTGVRDHYAKELKTDDFPVMATHKCRRWSQAAKKFNLIYNPYMLGT